MAFVWDNAKAASNLSKHTVSFEYATRAFLDKHRVTVVDNRKNYGEKRYVVWAAIERRVFVVSYTLRGKDIRIISARKANKREQKKYNAVRTES